MLKRVLTVTGMFLLVMGTLWALQGLGLVKWPPESFMLDRRDWALYGAVTAAIGAGILWLGRSR
ncbi:MAG: hypothetical protein O9266_09845 [Porphyrobacter sp.]|jgi:hypothetical protein|nr:hypothetical protein [Porphyrobacter sp.]